MLIQDGYDKNRLAGARFDINGRSPTATAEYFEYDASGNVWYDRHAKTSYKLNAIGLPEVAYIQNEYDGDLGKYYFGALYFDPFFGLWMSPDPASVFFREVYTPLKWRNFIKKDILRRSNSEAVLLKHSFRASAQFANSYSYGGDPINYIDPTGLWAVGLGFVVGWDNKSGWSFGVGAAADFEVIGADFSYRFNQDGSKSLNLGVKADIPIPTPWGYLEINMGLGFSMNSYSGATLSTHGGLCVGEVGLCGGVETGGSLYWDRGGSFMGATVYAEAYASLGYGMDRVSTGYEAGFFGMEGRGLYAGASAGGLYAQVAENGGWNYGFNAHVYYGVTDNGNKMAADEEHREVSRLLWIPELGRNGMFKLGESCDETNLGLQLNQKKYLMDLAKKKGDDNHHEFLMKAYGDGTELSQADFATAMTWLNTNGYEEVWRPSLPFSGYDKKTFIKAGSEEYGNYEFKYPKNGNVFSSYNYANNLLDHFWLDVIGFTLSN